MLANHEILKNNFLHTTFKVCTIESLKQLRWTTKWHGTVFRWPKLLPTNWDRLGILSSVHSWKIVTKNCNNVICVTEPSTYISKYMISIIIWPLVVMLQNRIWTFLWSIKLHFFTAYKLLWKEHIKANERSKLVWLINSSLAYALQLQDHLERFLN